MLSVQDFISLFAILTASIGINDAQTLSMIANALVSKQVPLELHLEGESQQGAVAAAFDAPYFDPWRNVSRIKDHLDACFHLHYDNIDRVRRFRAPYFTIAQSSGMGKSKLIAELAKEVPLIYVSLPPR